MRYVSFLHVVFPFIFLFLIHVEMAAQSVYKAKGGINMVVSGTSTLHDWTMKSASGDCSATFTGDAAGQLTDVTALQFSVSSKALKSGKSGMDENAYDALKADRFPTITAQLKEGSLTARENGMYAFKGVVRLTVAGKTRDTDLVATVQKQTDGVLHVKGEKIISMRDYDMTPPSFMMGTIKTGNDIQLSFQLNLSK